MPGPATDDGGGTSTPANLSPIAVPGPSNRDDFEELNKIFKKPIRKTRAAPKRAKKQPDIRKILKINPELDFRDEEKLQRMILHKSRDDNVSADDLQMALALSRSISESNGQLPEKPVAPKSRKKAVEFFEMMGMTSKKRTRKCTKSTLLTRRDADKENTKVQARIEELIQSTYPESLSTAGSWSKGDLSISSCYLYDMRVPCEGQRIMDMNDRSEDTTNGLDEYYIPSKLFPETTVTAGYLLRDWGKIPGRSPSPECASPRQDALDFEVENHLNAIHKQSADFLQNFEWKDKSGSPDLFGDLSLSTDNAALDKNEEVERTMDAVQGTK